MILRWVFCRTWNGQVGGLYAGEEVTAVGQQGAWLHVRLYEFDEDEEDKEDDQDVRVRLPPSATWNCCRRAAESPNYFPVKFYRFCG